MKVRLLAGTVNGKTITGKQHFTCFVFDDCVALDAGSLAHGTSEDEKMRIRDVVLSHAHLDHIAGLPLFVDDLFAFVREPVKVHATAEVIEVLERDIFNWNVYPRFSELENDFGKVLEYELVSFREPFAVRHLTFEAAEVNHRVPSAGFSVSDGSASIAITGDTAEMGFFWRFVNDIDGLDALFIECAFPNRMSGLAEISHHMTPRKLALEMGKFGKKDCPVFAVNLKPMFLEETRSELEALEIDGLRILEVGREYEF